MRMALVASKQDQLARLASQATALLSSMGDGLLAQRPGIFAADSADGLVTLLLSDAGDRAAEPDTAADAAWARHPADPVLPSSALRWLDELGVSAAAAVGYGHGEIAGLVWAGCLTEADAAALTATRTKILYATPAPHSPAVTVTAVAGTAAATTGREVGSADDVLDLLCAPLDCPAGLGPALQAGAYGASLLLETGPGQVLAEAAAVISEVPAISLGAGAGVDAARAAAALFAAGALEHPGRLFAGRPSRPIDIWREQTYITSPCQAPPPTSPAGPAARQPRSTDSPRAAGTPQAGASPASLPAAPLAQAAAMAQRVAAAGLAAAAQRTSAAPVPGLAAAQVPAPAWEEPSGRRT